MEKTNCINFYRYHKSGRLSELQYNLLSWYGYSLFMYHHHNDEKYYWVHVAYYNACNLAAVPPLLVTIAGAGNICGLINFNVMATVARFSADQNMGGCKWGEEIDLQGGELVTVDTLAECMTGAGIAANKAAFYQSWASVEKPTEEMSEFFNVLNVAGFRIAVIKNQNN